MPAFALPDLCSVMLPDSRVERVDWLFLDLNSYFASVEQQENPALRGQPVAVVPVMTNHTCAIAASYEAKRFGIKTGTMIHEARGRCPQLQCVLARHDIYVAYHHRILAEIEHHIPVTNVMSIDEVACRLTGKWREPDRAVELALKIKDGIARSVGECLTSSVGISTNRFLAKVASDLHKPNGLTTLLPTEIPERLADLELTDLPGIGHNMHKRLLAARITTIEQLWACAPKELRAIWGSVAGERFWYALRGAEIPELPTRHSVVGHSHVLAPEERLPALARTVASRMVLKAASRLREMSYLARAMILGVRMENGPRLAWERRFVSLSDSVTLQEIFTRLWEQAEEHIHGARIKKVSITLHGLIPAGELRQLELFTQSAPTPEAQPMDLEKRARLSEAIDAINRRCGRNAASIGIMPENDRNFTGAKVAFSRVPKITEYHGIPKRLETAPFRESEVEPDGG